MMKNEFVPYEEALALKELGFNETCFTFYTDEQELYNSEGWGYNQGKNVLGDEVVAPLYQQAFRWFRQEHGLFSEINLTTKQENVAEFEFFILNFYEPIFESDDYKNYESCKLDCLRKLIEHVKTK